MILGAHVIITAYGFWLPNEERGSWSDFVRSWELLRFGLATKVDTHRSVARKPHDRKRKHEMQAALKYPPVVFNGKQALAIARGFAEEARHSGCKIHAFAMMPEHNHVVLGRHRYDFDKLINRLKGSATRSLKEHGMYPLAEYSEPEHVVPSPWGRKWWKVYLDSEADMRRAIDYTNENPLKEGKPRQKWNFVEPYEV
jgi:REP element-mobilizing transposase RayT